MALGGDRPGSGRPRKSTLYGGQITEAERRIADRLPSIIDRAFDLADGVLVEEDDPDAPNGKRVYRRIPDIKSITYLIDRIMGKPAQALHVSGEDGGAVLIGLVEAVVPLDIADDDDAGSDAVEA